MNPNPSVSEQAEAKKVLPIEIELQNAGFEMNAATKQYEQKFVDGLIFVANILTSSDLAGLGFITLEPDTNNPQVALDAAVQQWGVEGVVSLIATAARNAQRNKARSSGLAAEPDAETVDKLRIADPIFWKRDNATKWKPGQRDLTVAGYDKLIRELLTTLRDAATPDKDKPAIRLKIREFGAARQELIDRETEEAIA